MKDKKPFEVIKYKYIAFGASLLFIVLGLVFFFACGGFNTGIDFGSGYSERVQIAPLGLYVSYSGNDSATLSVNSGVLTLQYRNSSGVTTYSYSSGSYKTVEELASQMKRDGLSVKVENGTLLTENLVSGFGFPATLSESPTRLNFATPTRDVNIEDIRASLSSLGNANIQTLGNANAGYFQVRVNVSDGETQSEVEERVNDALSSAFGSENVVVMQSDFVGPKFSSSLLKSSFYAILIAILMILLYISLRFRFSYALSSIIALFHDVLMMLALILIFRLEVSATTIAAILTIIGYSLNNTIVIFDRVRENIKEDRKKSVDELINLSVRQSLTRTVITSLTTLCAIVPLAIFATGDIKLFAINLTWGVVVGAYSSNFIAPGLLSLFNRVSPINKIKIKKNEDYSLV